MLITFDRFLNRLKASSAIIVDDLHLFVTPKVEDENGYFDIDLELPTGVTLRFFDHDNEKIEAHEDHAMLKDCNGNMYWIQLLGNLDCR
jgi:hypothetical protein